MSSSSSSSHSTIMPSSLASPRPGGRSWTGRNMNGAAPTGRHNVRNSPSTSPTTTTTAAATTAGRGGIFRCLFRYLQTWLLRGRIVFLLIFTGAVGSVTLLSAHWAISVLDHHQQQQQQDQQQQQQSSSGKMFPSTTTITRMKRDSISPITSSHENEDENQDINDDIAVHPGPEDGANVAAVVVRNRPSSSSPQLSFPILNVGLPKSGEDTLWNVFQNDVGFVTQYGCGDLRRPRKNCVSVGHCIANNIIAARKNNNNNNDVWTDCPTRQLAAVDPHEPEFQVYTRLDEMRYLSRRKPVKTGQYLPQIHFLQALYDHAPNATWILPLQSPRNWAYTFSRQRMLRKRYWNEVMVMKYNLSPSHPLPFAKKYILEKAEPLEIPAVDHWTNFYRQHIQRIRNFVQQHPSLGLVEVQYGLPSAYKELMDVLVEGQLIATAPQQTATTNQTMKCLNEECDLWKENLEWMDHHKRTPRPRRILQQRLSFPIIVVGLPKSGTTSVSNFFACAGALSQHYCSQGDVSPHRPCYSTPIMADCILDNIKLDRPMLENCGDYDLYAQIDGEVIYDSAATATDPRGSNPGRQQQQQQRRSKNFGNGIEDKLIPGHYLPQVFDLDRIHRDYPNATFLLPLRASTSWALSVSRWFNMRHRMFSEYRYRNHSHEIEGVERPLVNLYEQHTQRILKFVREHPSHKLISFDITDPTAGKILANETGLPESCWGHHNGNSERLV